MVKEARGLIDVKTLSTVITLNSVSTVGIFSLVIVFPLITSLSAPVSIIAFTTTDAPEDEFITRTGTMGLITLSSALTTHFAVVAASQRTVFCWTSTVLDGFVASAEAASFVAEIGRKSMASGERVDF